MTVQPQARETIPSAPQLSQVLDEGQVWQGRYWQHHAFHGLDTRHDALNQLFAGWPQGALTEVLYSQAGIGEMRMLVPALAELSQQNRWIMMIAPPFMPNADALTAAGVDSSKLLIVRPESVNDLLWTLEESLRSGTCSAVLAWPSTLNPKATRRLQLAAETGKALGILFRPLSQASEASPAALRLKVSPAKQGTQAQVLKRRGGWTSEPVQMNLGFAELAASEPRPLQRPRHTDTSPVVQGPWLN